MSLTARLEGSLRFVSHPRTPLGIVRLIRFGVCGLMRSQFSGGELMPFSERCRSVLLEDVAAIEVAVLIEVIMDRGVNGGKLL